MTVFRTDEVLNVEKKEPGYGGVWFLNWKFKPKPFKSRSVTDPGAYMGIGLYALCFDEELIYIGSFLGSRKPLGNSGDVVTARWWTHLGSITARSYDFFLARRNFEAIRDRLAEGSELRNGLLGAADIELLFRPRGNLCPFRRLLFADARRDVFLDPDCRPEEVLKRFSFTYIRCDALAEEIEVKDGMKHIEEAEKLLIRKYAPACNTAHVPPGAAPVRLTEGELEGVLKSALKRSAEPTEMREVSSEAVSAEQTEEAIDVTVPELIDLEQEPDLGAEEWSAIFWSRLRDAGETPCAIIDYLRGLALRHYAIEVYTGTDDGDLRFKWRTVSGRDRVFMRLSWRTRAKKFVVFSLCPPETVRADLAALGLFGEVKETGVGESCASSVDVPGDFGYLPLLGNIFLCSIGMARKLP